MEEKKEKEKGVRENICDLDELVTIPVPDDK